jgi:hypothetical protein
VDELPEEVSTVLQIHLLAIETGISVERESNDAEAKLIPQNPS